VNLEQWIADAEARVAAADKYQRGPWSLTDDLHVVSQLDRYGDVGGIIVVSCAQEPFQSAQPEVGAFIAHAKTDLPAALKLLKAALAVVEEARHELEGTASYRKTFLRKCVAAFDAAAKEVTGE
jgi:hypothetical protein